MKLEAKSSKKKKKTEVFVKEEPKSEIKEEASADNQNADNKVEVDHVKKAEEPQSNEENTKGQEEEQ